MASYRVIGMHQCEYNPVNPELLRDWFGEGRLNATTLVRAEGSSDWQSLGALPKFRPFVASLTSGFYRDCPGTHAGWFPGGVEECL